MISGVKKVNPILDGRTKRLLYRVITDNGHYLYSDGKISPILQSPDKTSNSGYELESIKGDYLDRVVYEIFEFSDGKRIAKHLLHDHEFVISSQSAIWCNIVDQDLFIRRHDEGKRWGAWRLEMNFERFSAWYDDIGAPYKTPTGKIVFIAKGMKDSTAVVDFVEQGWHPVVIHALNGYKFGNSLDKLNEVVV